MLCHIQIHLLILLEILSFLSHGLNPLAAFTIFGYKDSDFPRNLFRISKKTYKILGKYLDDKRKMPIFAPTNPARFP